MPGESPTLPRWAVAVPAALCALALLYTLYRGAVVTLEYFDGYQFLVTAKRLAGDRATAGFNLVRPPLLALLDLPALWLAQRGAPANLGYTLGPHLTAALLSVCSALAAYYALRAVFPTRLALVGLCLLVTGRMFVRYGSLTMADVLSMGLGALAMGLHLRTLQRSTWRRDLLVGLAIGLGAAAKYPLLLMGAVVALAELLVAVKRRRLPLRRLGGLAASGAAAAASFVLVLVLAHGLGLSWKELGKFPAAMQQAFTMATGMVKALAGESRWDNAVMIAVTTAWPILALAVLGLGLFAKERQERDLPFLAWLVGLGGILIATIGHNEVRYLLPAIPALIYFAVRGIEWLLARVRSPVLAGAGLVVLVVGCAWGGAQQAWADADPAFRADTPRKAAQALVRLRRPGGHLRWIGPFSCIYPVRRVPLPKDEFFDSFNFYGPSMIYFLGEPATVIPSVMAAGNGDAVVTAGPNCNGMALPATPPGPWVVQGVSRRPLEATAGAHATAENDLTLSVVAGARPVVRVTRGMAPRADAQRFLIVSDPAPRLIGPLPLTTGSEVPCNGAALKSVELLELTAASVPAR